MNHFGGIIIVLFLSLLAYDLTKEATREIIEPTPIVAVYYHEYGRYSVMIKENNVLTPIQVPYDYGRIKTKIITDAQDDMWYACDYAIGKMAHDISGGCEIHIYSIDDVNTAGWNHGKFGSGQTTRID